MRVSTILTLDRTDFDAIFQEINLNLSRKLYALTFGLQNLVAWQRLCSQHPSACLFYPSELSAILCEPCSPKSRFFLLRRNFPPYIRETSRVPPRVLALWAKTEPCVGNNQTFSWSHGPVVRGLTFCILHWRKLGCTFKSPRRGYLQCFFVRFFFLHSIFTFWLFEGPKSPTKWTMHGRGQASREQPREGEFFLTSTSQRCS